MFIYFFVIFEVHYTVSRYNICLEEYMDLSLRLSGTKSEEEKERQPQWAGIHRASLNQKTHNLWEGQRGVGVKKILNNRVIHKVTHKTPVCILKKESEHQTFLCTKRRLKKIWTGV